MTDPLSSKNQPLSPAPQARDVSAAAMILNAGAAEISAEAEERDRSRSELSPNPAISEARPDARRAVVRRRREPIRQPRATSQFQRALVPVNPTALVGTPHDPGEESRPDTRSEL